ncbi:8688_t:CDS:2 [Racocetra persica]|uniref:8688_t:CDS:1 n=1 Tax=Racocetra persica TaxID=160502 RepID=A0ACA9RIF7_9GLOM|nr:8688_t:CDS:2 [Racocetra persica]
MTENKLQEKKQLSCFHCGMKEERPAASPSTTKTSSEASLDNQNSLHSKLYKIQSEIGSLFRTQENRYQKYKYFNEKQCLELLKPLLEKHKVAIYFSDEISSGSEPKGDNFPDIGADMYFKKEDKEWVVKYLKKAEIVNVQDKITPRDLVNSTQSDLINYRVSEEKMTFRFWAIGSNTDPAKAKGSAETYALKYFLSKFFLIPVRDENDPDSGNKEVEKIIESNRPLTETERLQAEKLLEKHGFNKELEKKLKETNEPLRMWEGKNKFQQEGSELDNCIFHQECLKLYRRIKALVFKQCSTEELEEELEGRK